MFSGAGGGAVQGPGDRGGVVVHHAYIRTAVGTGRTHRVGKQTATDSYFPSSLATAFENSFDILIRDARFDEDRLNFTGGNEIDQFIDVLEVGLGFGTQSLYRLNIDIVSAGEVSEGIVCGDQDSLLRGNGSDRLADKIIQCRQALPIGASIFCVLLLLSRIVVTERRGDIRDARAPGLDVHPDVRIPVTGEFRWFSQQSPVDALGDRESGDSCSLHPGKGVTHSPLEHQARIEDDIRLGQLLDIRPGRAIEMGIDSFSHDSADDGFAAHDLLDDIGHHSAGGDYLKRLREVCTEAFVNVLGRRRFVTTSESDASQETRHEGNSPSVLFHGRGSIQGVGKRGSSSLDRCCATCLLDSGSYPSCLVAHRKKIAGLLTTARLRPVERGVN